MADIITTSCTPLSLSEINNNSPVRIKMPDHCHLLIFPERGENITELFKFGRFPEPLLDREERTLLRWQNG
ncbi:MAG: hypothetical protein L3J69_10570 [Desulfobacula sp.]|nr:hypothetical protein [Desulfobacula sp.]